MLAFIVPSKHGLRLWLHASRFWLPEGMHARANFSGEPRRLCTPPLRYVEIQLRAMLALILDSMRAKSCTERRAVLCLRSNSFLARKGRRALLCLHSKQLSNKNERRAALCLIIYRCSSSGNNILLFYYHVMFIFDSSHYFYIVLVSLDFCI